MNALLTILLLTGGPMTMLKDANDELRAILKQPKTQQSLRIRAIVDGFLDYEELGRRSLGAHWETLADAERQEFLRVFRKLIERSYIRQLRNNVDYQIEYR